MLPTHPQTDEQFARSFRGTPGRTTTGDGPPSPRAHAVVGRGDSGRQEARLLKAEEIAALGSWELDLRSGELACSPEMKRMFGWSEHPATGLTAIRDAAHPDDRCIVEKWLATIDAGKLPGSGIDFRTIRDDGAIRTLHLLTAATLLDHGEPLVLAGTIQDITDRLALERATGETEQVYRGMFENALWGIFQTTPEGRYIRVNRALSRIYGYNSPEALVTALTNISRQLYVNPDRREEFVRLMRENGQLSGFESLVYQHDGSLIWISESCREIRAASGELLYYEGTVEDITHRKHSEADLMAAREEAEQASQAKSLFLAKMSHELRTPLNAVLGFSEILNDELFGPLDDKRYKEFAADIHGSGRHLLDIINDILDLTKVEAGQLQLDDQLIDLDDLLHTCERLIAKAAARQDVQLIVESQAVGAVLRADPIRLKQILLNLLSNAVKFTPAGHKVELTARREEEAFVIEVRDTGIGMTPDDVVLALQPFQQVDNSFSRRHEGTGLGLPLTKSLVELHGGVLTIESAPSIGTTVAVRLPSWRFVNPSAMPFGN